MCFFSNRNWTDDLATIQKSIDKEITPSQNKFNVDRADVFGSFIITSRRRNFDPMSRIDVVFVDALGAVEGAIDSGGPTREFLRLLVKEVITGPCFEGPAASRNLRYSTECM
jgi:predicted nucleotidyltransferase